MLTKESKRLSHFHVERFWKLPLQSFKKGLAKVLISLTILALVQSMANAETGENKWTYAVGHWKSAMHYYLGSFKNARDEFAFCADAELGDPVQGGNYQLADKSPPKRQDGTEISSRDRTKVAFLMAKYGRTTSTEEAAAVQIAIWTITSPGFSFGSPALAQRLSGAEATPEMTSRAKEMLAEAEKYNLPNELAFEISFEPVASDDATPEKPMYRVKGRVALSSVEESYLAFSGQILNEQAGEHIKHDNGVFEFRVEAGQSLKLKATQSRIPEDVNWLLPSNPASQRIMLVTQFQDMHALWEGSAPQVPPKQLTPVTSKSIPTQSQLPVTVTPPANLTPEIPEAKSINSPTPAETPSVSKIPEPIHTQQLANTGVRWGNFVQLTCVIMGAGLVLIRKSKVYRCRS